MATTIRWFNNFMRERQDIYTKDWFMVGNLTNLMLVLASYVIFSTKIGPWLMKNRKPFKLTRTIQIYNIFQVVANGFLVSELRRACWIYFLLKLSDLLDTVFFVLRKKYNQVTFLHVYHHTLMPLCSFIGVTFVPGGHGTLLGLCNSFVHVILYSYYFLASLGPEVQKYLWWKKYVTKIQLIQFVIILIHNLQVIPRDCNYPKIFNILLVIQGGYFIYLFGSFYVRAYIEKKPQTTIIKDSVNQEKEENGSHKLNGSSTGGNNGYSSHIGNGKAKIN